MDDAEIQLRLSACRPNGQDNDDPCLREAMETLPCRPELAAWFSQEQAFDRCLCKAISEMPIPENLRAEILAAAKLSAAVPRWQRLPWLATAAAVLLGGLIFVIREPEPKQTSLAQFETEIVDMFDHMKTEGFGLEHVTGELSNVSAWLGNQGAPKPYIVQPGTKEARPFGCRIVTWRGQKVAMVCFGRGNQEAHLFVVLRDSLNDMPANIEPQKVEHVDGYPVAAWSCRKCAYVMMGSSPETKLEEFLADDSDLK
ncbi:hypothetical protein SAMN02745166_02714 [Prosthecobacter debontii]|uniref:DUF3379 domain-containing protein n=1 Tax=Prosthecobacter debontii TaxID=48467 RepID=A0A1T4Y8Z8_9BACT|nr:hypothetical protein [Prosthecobacter debontii]SKA98259.1 hypothetical protein SAMN02745166_02714 [Prosthecobacter debontii]